MGDLTLFNRFRLEEPLERDKRLMEYKGVDLLTGQTVLVKILNDLRMANKFQNEVKVLKAIAGHGNLFPELLFESLEKNILVICQTFFETKNNVLQLLHMRSADCRRRRQKFRENCAKTSPISLTKYNDDDDDTTNNMAKDVLPSGSFHQKYSSSYKMTHEEVAQLAVEMINRLETIHTLGVLHNNVNPLNIYITSPFIDDHEMLFSPELFTNLCLSDFSNASFYNAEDNSISRKFKGTFKFASINSHCGIKLGRADDLESLAYTLIFLAKGKLPWSSSDDKSLDINKKNMYYLEMKKNISIDEICEGLPDSFSLFLSSVRSLDPNELPNYENYRNLFRPMIAPIVLQPLTHFSSARERILPTLKDHTCSSTGGNIQSLNRKTPFLRTIAKRYTIGSLHEDTQGTAKRLDFKKNYKAHLLLQQQSNSPPLRSTNK